MVQNIHKLDKKYMTLQAVRFERTIRHPMGLDQAAWVGKAYPRIVAESPNRRAQDEPIALAP